MFAALCPGHIYILENDTLQIIKHISLDFDSSLSVKVGAAFNANSTLFAAFHATFVTVWNVANGFELMKHVDIGMSIYLSSNILFLRTVDELLLPIYKKLVKFSVESETVSTPILTKYNSICLSPDDQRLVADHCDQIFVYALEGMVETLRFPCTRISIMTATNCFERLITASYGGLVTVFNLSTGEVIAQRHLGTTTLLNLGFGIFQQSFYVRVPNKFVLLRVADLGEEQVVVCEQSLESSAFDPGFNRILISYERGKIEQRDVDSGEVRVGLIEQNSCFRIIIAPQGGVVLM